MRYGIYKGLRDSAWRCLKDNKVSSLPVDVLGIAKLCGIRVIKNTQVNVLTPKENGRSFFDGDEWFIIYNDLNPIEISRFTIAHELGHFFLGHELAHVKYSDIKQFSPKPKSEQQADMFAARLLCPACVLWALNLHTVKDITNYCKVPLEIAQTRSERMKELYKRNKFLTNPLEKEVYNNFVDNIRNINRSL